MKIISWNTNGLRACKLKGFDEFFSKEDADLFCIQETKMQEGQADLSKEEIARSYKHVTNKIRRRKSSRIFKFWACSAAASEWTYRNRYDR